MGEAKRRKEVNPFVENYVRHLPEIAINTPFEPGSVTHTVVSHDDWCALLRAMIEKRKPEPCNCRPVVRRYREPLRS